MSTLHTGLAWLPRPPADFAASCKALGANPAPGAAIRRLANHGLDDGQLTRLGKAVVAARADGRPLAPLEPFRLGLVGNSTLDLLSPILCASAARHGLALECIQADFGQMTQEALDAASRINTARPDAVLLAIDYHGLPLRFLSGDPSAESSDIEAAVTQINAMREGFRRHSGAISIVQTLAPPPDTLFGSFDRLVPGTPRRLVERLNRALCESIVGTEDVLLDVATIAETVGIGTWHSPPLWNLAKLAFSESCLPLYADHVARLLGALRGKSRKCLILDLDNTVWGGVIGDDGLDGIKIAQGDATGEAHLAVQQLALAYRRRGIVLAVSSKNTDEIARGPFREHPEMLLKEDHFAVFQANWNDKATNIKAIAEELSLGLDAMVFLDDNPVERELVRQVLPQVAVPELPDDPAWFAPTLSAAGYFESVAFSEEDLKRAEMYQSNARRVALQGQVGDLDSYLASLEMEITFAPFDRTGRARISQLINKSNQFNLTTHRYSEADVAALEQNSQILTLQVRLIDRFGDNGMIGVVICRSNASSEWLIDTWLMSCRVLGRKVEQMVLREVVSRAREAGIATLVGIFSPTEKNALVRDHYKKLGFAETRIAETSYADLDLAAESTVWKLATAREIDAAPMTVRRLDPVGAPA